MWPRVFLGIRIAFALAFAALAFSVLSDELRHLSLADIGTSLASIGPGATWLAALATLAGFAAIAPYDAFALHYIGKRLSLPRSAVSSTTSYAVSNVLGFPVFTGNAVRYWLFERWGLGASDTAVAAIVTTIACNLALTLIIGVALIAEPSLLTRIPGAPAELGFAIGIALLLVGSAVAVVAITGPRTFSLWRFSMNRPGLLLIPHLVACTIDYLAAAAVLYIPLSSAISMDFLPFVALFALAKLAGIASNVPGGVGVFEAIMISVLPSGSESMLAACLLVYRALYFLAPFGIAAVILAVHGLARARRRTSPRRQ